MKTLKPWEVGPEEESQMTTKMWFWKIKVELTLKSRMPVTQVGTAKDSHVNES